jgi:hypothetical protein
MAYYFHSKNDQIKVGGSHDVDGKEKGKSLANEHFGISAWDELADEFLHTPAALRVTYSFLPAVEKLAHCSVSKVCGLPSFESKQQRGAKQSLHSFPLHALRVSLHVSPLNYSCRHLQQT